MSRMNQMRFDERKLWCAPLLLVECAGDMILLELVHHQLQRQPWKNLLMKVMMKLFLANIMKLKHQRRKKINGKRGKQEDRLKILHMSQDIQNKIIMQKCEGGKMKNVRNRSLSWKKKPKLRRLGKRNLLH